MSHILFTHRSNRGRDYIKRFRFCGSQVSIEGKELPYAPAHTFLAGIYKNFGEKASIRLDVKYVSEVYTDFENIKRTDNIGIRDCPRVCHFKFEHKL